MYSPVLLRHSLVHWWDHFFTDIRRNLFSLKQVVQIGANNSQLLLFSPTIDMLDKLLSLPSTGFSCRYITSSWMGGSKWMFGGFMLAANSFWDMFASGSCLVWNGCVSWHYWLLGCLYLWKCSGLGNIPLSWKCLLLRSTINNISRIQNFPAVNTLIVALKGFKNTVSVYTGLAAWKINDFHWRRVCATEA